MLRTALIIGLVAGVYFWMPGGRPAVNANLTDVQDPVTAQAMVQVSRPTVAQSESYVGNKVRLIGGWLKNVSNKPIRLVDVKMEFQDFDGKAIQAGVHPAYDAKQRPLAPGAEYRFEIAFEDLPRTWNYRAPVMQVVRVAY